jgi:outer membrane immunogenic protein
VGTCAARHAFAKLEKMSVAILVRNLWARGVILREVVKESQATKQENSMKKFLLSTLSVVAMAAPAIAADLPARPYKAPPPVVMPVYDWTGFYIGGNGGWGESRNCWNLVPLTGTVLGDGCLSKSGGLIGGQVGYRWQTGAMVLGLEAQGDWANLNGTHVSLLDPTFTLGTKVEGLGLFTGQIGWAWNATLLYFKGGAAVTSNRFFVNNTLTGLGLATASATRWGGTVGIGGEYGFSPNWTVGIEYDHLFMGDSNNSFSVVNPLAAGALNRISQDVDMVTLRFNYKFGGYGAPVVSKY